MNKRAYHKRLFSVHKATVSALALSLALTACQADDFKSENLIVTLNRALLQPKKPPNSQPQADPAKKVSGPELVNQPQADANAPTAEATSEAAAATATATSADKPPAPQAVLVAPAPKEGEAAGQTTAETAVTGDDDPADPTPEEQQQQTAALTPPPGTPPIGGPLDEGAGFGAPLTEAAPGVNPNQQNLPPLPQPGLTPFDQQMLAVIDPTNPLQGGLQLQPPKAAGPLRVGLLLPLTGQHQAIGEQMLNAAMLALFDIGSDTVELLPKDTQGSPEGARQAAQQAIEEGASLLLGPLFSKSVSATIPVLYERDVPMISFSNDRAVTGNGVFIMGFTPEEQIEEVVDYAVRQGRRRFAIIAPDDSYGQRAVTALKSATDLLGADLVRIQFYPADQGTFSDEMNQAVRRLADYDARRSALRAEKRRLEGQKTAQAYKLLKQLSTKDTFGELGFDALLIPDGGERLKALASLLPHYDVDDAGVQLLGMGQWDDPRILREPALEGGWFAGIPAKNREEYRQHYKRVFGHFPARITSLAYDATALAVTLGIDKPSRFEPRAISNPSGFAGTDGIFRFGANGVVDRGLAILQVGSKGFNVLQPPLTTFQVQPDLSQADDEISTDASEALAPAEEPLFQEQPGSPTVPSQNPNGTTVIQ